MKKLKIILVAGISLLAVSSCSFFEERPDDFVSKEDNFKEKSVIYADFAGLLALLQDVVDQLVFVTELRGDMMMPTDQADEKYKDVYNYRMTNAEANDLYDPAPFYKLVMNSNDFMRNLVDYNAKYPGVIPTNTYRQMIAGAVCLRTWAYLTLGKLYGGAVYYDYAMTGEIDIAKMVDENWIELDELVPQLIYFLIHGVDNVNGLMLVKIDEILGISGTQWRRMSIAPDPLLTELYLWNKNYDMASKRGIYLVSDKGVVGADPTNVDKWALSRYFQGPNWDAMFNTTWSSAHENESMTSVFWNTNENQENAFMKSYNTSYYRIGGEYTLMPTQAYIDMFDYNASLTDYRLTNTVSTQNGLDVISKFNQFGITESYFHIYRAGELFLHIAESLTGEGKFEAADSIINYGTRASTSGDVKLYPFQSPAWSHARFKNCNGIRGRIGYQNGGTSRMPKITSTDAAFMNAELRTLNLKLRNGKDYDYQVIKEIGPSDDQWPLYEEYVARRTFVIDSLISLETGRELGFEGKRFFTLVRMAKHLNNPDILALQVSKKYIDLNDRYEAAQILRNKESWFIKYDLKLMKQ